MAKVKVALYLRVSTEHQTTDMQRRDLVKYCELHNLEYDIFMDTYTGTKLTRPDFNRMMDLCREGQYKKIIVWKFDRLSRRVRDFLNIVHELSDVGVDLISFKDAVDSSTPMGRAMMQMILILSELEVEHIRERVRAGLSAARARGVKLGAPSREVDAVEIEKLRGLGMKIEDIAKRFGFSRAQMYRRVKSV